jgi:dipeptidyl aminopeptidase/acylaminoacyl peptidase
MEKTIWFYADDYRLHGTLHLPAAGNAPVVIGCHGLLSSGDSPKQIALAGACTAAGIAYFRFDHRGCGRSEGLFTEATSLEGRIRDLLAALEALRQLGDLRPKRTGLFGSSFGGSVVLSAAPLINPLAVVTVAAPIRSRDIRKPYTNRESDEKWIASMNPDDLFFDISQRISGVCELLVFHGDADMIVPFTNCEEIYETASRPKEFIRLENGDHPMSDPDHQRLFMEKTTAWFRERLL